MINFRPHLTVHFVFVDKLRVLFAAYLGRVWIIATEQNMAPFGETEDQREHFLASGKRKVKIKVLGLLHNIVNTYRNSKFGQCYPGNLTELKIQAIVQATALRGIGQSRGIIDISVNILGAGSVAERVGEALEKLSAFLQHPLYLEAGYKYSNPQYYNPGTARRYLTHLVGLTEEDIKSKIISNEIEGILASLDAKVNLTDVENNEAMSDIATPLKPYEYRNLF
jgi:hypothetical protein